MRKFIKGIGLFLCLFLLPIYVSAGEPFPAAPDFKLDSLLGEKVTLSGYKDKQAVLLFFWTTWCPYCRSELKELEQAQPDLLKEKIAVLAINSGEQKPKVENFLRGRNLSFKILLDTDRIVSYRYNLLGIPTYFLINKRGQIVFSGNHFPEDQVKGVNSN